MSAKNPRIDIGGILGWAGESGRAFRKLLAHENLIPYLNALLSPGYRLCHQPLCLVNNEESEGFMLHGGPKAPKKRDTTTGELKYAEDDMNHFDTGMDQPFLQYKCGPDG